MTKKEMFVALRARVADDAEMVAFIDHEIELLSRKRSTGKPTKNQLANKGIKDEIISILAESKDLRAGDIVKLMDEKYSLPKVSALLKQLVESGKVVKTTEKKVSRFSLAE